MNGTYFGINGKRPSTGSKFGVIWPPILIIHGGSQQPPFGKYVWEKCSEELGLSNWNVSFYQIEHDLLEHLRTIIEHRSVFEKERQFINFFVLALLIFKKLQT